MTASLEQALSTATGAARAGVGMSREEALTALNQALSLAASPDAQLAPWLGALRHRDLPPSAIAEAASARVAKGPLRDALACLAFVDPTAFFLEEKLAAARGRLDLLLWEAGAQAVVSAGVAACLKHEVSFAALVGGRVRGALRDRSLAARTIAIAADDLAESALAPAMERAARVLAGHPDPAVWMPAARAVGRLAIAIPEARTRILIQLQSTNAGERRRAVTQLAAAPASCASWALGPLTRVLEETTDPWTVAAVGPALPHWAREHRALWDRMAERATGDQAAAGAEVLSSLTHGLVALARRDELDRSAERVLRHARERALSAAPRSETESLLWRAIVRATDFLDGLEPDPTDPELGLERALSAAVRHGAARVLDRASFLGRSLRSTFEGAHEAAAQATEREERDAALAVMESCARAAALALWVPIARAAGRDPQAIDAEADRARRAMFEISARDLKKPKPDFERDRVALRVLGALADAASFDDSLGVRGGTGAQIVRAIQTSPWLFAWKKRDASRFEKPVADLLWRVLDATRTLANPAQDPLLFPRFTAWWTLAWGRSPLLDVLGRSDAVAREARSFGAATAIATIVETLDLSAPGACEGAWATAMHEALDLLGAADTALARAVAAVAAALSGLRDARAWLSAEGLRAGLLPLAQARDAIVPLLQNPSLALAAPAAEQALFPSARSAGPQSGHEISDARQAPLLAEDTLPSLWRPSSPSGADSASRPPQEQGPSGRVDSGSPAAPAPHAAGRTHALVEETLSVRTGADPAGLAAHWREGMGPLLGPLAERAVLDVCQLHHRADVAPPGSGPLRIGRYLLHSQLGAGAMGAVWLAKDPMIERYFVMKLPAGNFTEQPPEARAELEVALESEANVLRALYHPNVATFVDHGWYEGRPYLVLEYLVGADLHDYACAGLLSAEELKPMVQDIAAGLRALHHVGLVHCDLKPGNVFLRLDLPPFTPFDPARHRAPEATLVRSAIVIDFGLVRAFGHTGLPGVPARGTPGFVAPEQAMGEPVIGPKADVYSLAATVYATMTGRRFFEEQGSTNAAFRSAATRAPLTDRGAVRGLPRKLATLLREATELVPSHRPNVSEFARRFSEI